MKKLLLFVIACFAVGSVSAQITTGEQTSTVLRTGNRAQKGNFGLYVGGNTSMFRNLADGDMEFSCLPLINLKYMVTDQIEARLGFEWYEQTNTASHDGESQFSFAPGVAYHFSNKNLLDVYAGAEMPFGFGSKWEGTGDDKESAGLFQWGLQPFIGLQAYVANLPVAIGLEYGVGLNYQHVGDGTLSSENMTVKKVDVHEGASTNHFRIGHTLRLTLSYYFNR